MKRRLIAPAQENGGEASIGREARLFSPCRFGREKSVAIAVFERLKNRGLGLVGLQQRPARLLGAAGAAGDLRKQLVGPFRRAQIAAGKTEIPIDYANQRQ